MGDVVVIQVTCHRRRKNPTIAQVNGLELHIYLWPSAITSRYDKSGECVFAKTPPKGKRLTVDSMLFCGHAFFYSSG